MNFPVLSSLLLFAPVVFALADDYRPAVVLNRLIYSGDHLLFRSIESYRPFHNDRPINASFRFTNSNLGLIFRFELGQLVYLRREAADLASQSFVIETLLGHERLQNFDCFQESSATLQQLISLCTGLIRMREPNENEQNEIEQLRREVPSKKFELTYDRGELSAYGAQLSQLKIHPAADYLIASFVRHSELNSVLIKGYEDETFALVHDPFGCRVSRETKKIEVVHCRGAIRVIGDQESVESVNKNLN